MDVMTCLFYSESTEGGSQVDGGNRYLSYGQNGGNGDLSRRSWELCKKEGADPSGQENEKVE